MSKDKYISRKSNRLSDYDYSTNGAYFVTFCTENRTGILWDDVGERIALPPEPQRLSEIGKIVKNAILTIEAHYPSVNVDKYCIMPDHVHLLLVLDNTSGSAMRSPTLDTIICQLKGTITKQVGRKIWQRSYYDHVIRGDEDYLEIWEYIENNPTAWHEKHLFIMQEKSK